ncbi:rRNA and tRNA processing protein [Apiospora phragmitis]|uniref:rRNA and tRNA processing protein n=1 Tax=Apiospora phragmitis TaxID=2905665 RepID=A0ABR1T8Y3_9PEZI
MPRLSKHLLARAHSPDSAARIYSDKIQHRPLYLHPNSPPPTANARAARRKARDEKNRKRKSQKPKALSASQRRKLGLYDIPKEGRRYAVFEPLKQLWVGYMREVLGSHLYTGGPACAAKLCAAEYHGAEVEVTRSGCPSRVGLKGIVVKDSRFAFEIITPKNELKLVPKEGTMFRLHIPAAAAAADNDETGTASPSRYWATSFSTGRRIAPTGSSGRISWIRYDPISNEASTTHPRFCSAKPSNHTHHSDLQLGVKLKLDERPVASKHST